jgi:hypothetical protein
MFRFFVRTGQSRAKRPSGKIVFSCSSATFLDADRRDEGEDNRDERD